MVRKNSVVGALCGLLVAIAGVVWVHEGMAQGGYDEYGYDYTERKFRQLYENADRDFTNNTGDQTRFRMQWSKLFNLQSPELSETGSWVTNSQVGWYVGLGGQWTRESEVSR